MRRFTTISSPAMQGPPWMSAAPAPFSFPALTRGAAIRSTPPLAEPSVKLPALPGCLDNFQRSQADEAILVNGEPDFGDR